MLYRIQTIQKKLPANTGALVISPQNRYYLTGFSSSEGYVLITPQQGVFLVDFRYFEAAKREVKTAQVEELTRLREQLPALLERFGIQTLLVESGYVSLASFAMLKGICQKVELPAQNALDEWLLSLRMVKDEEELGYIQQAQSITEHAFYKALDFICPGVSEREIYNEILFDYYSQGASGMAFETIVASGPNSSSPHASVSDRRVQEGDFITIDMGAKYNGYCSDMTRTVAVGHASEHMQRIYQTVLQAQLGALNVLSANKTGHEVDAVARNIIDQAGYKGAFGHSLGHSVGLDIHEEPRLSLGYEKTLPAGVVITVEPGIYLAGDCGVRIEDMALLQENGCRNLTHVAKELLVLK